MHVDNGYSLLSRFTHTTTWDQTDNPNMANKRTKCQVRINNENALQSYACNSLWAETSLGSNATRCIHEGRQNKVSSIMDQIHHDQTEPFSISKHLQKAAKTI